MERKIQMEFLTNDLILRTVTNSDIEEIVKMVYNTVILFLIGGIFFEKILRN